MKKTIFYSWQSDSSPRDNRFLIRDALEAAVLTLNQEFTIDEATREIPGHASIFDSIMRKIQTAALFIGDLTLVGEYSNMKNTPNPNVLIEYGYALSTMGDRKIIPVMNTFFGSPELLPFDLRHRNVRVQYHLDPNTEEEWKKHECQRLTDSLRQEIMLVWRNVLSGGLTDQEFRIVELFVSQSEGGRPGSPRLSYEQLQQALNLDAAEVHRAIDQLEGKQLIERLVGFESRGGSIAPTLQLFVDFDAFFLEWNPAQDARTIAEDLVTGPHPERNQLAARELQDRYGWPLRRINPALQFLVKKGFVGGSKEHHQSYAVTFIRETPETRRFVRTLAGQ